MAASTGHRPRFARLSPTAAAQWTVPRIRNFLIDMGLTLLSAAAAIAMALWVTPMQSVSAAGQTVQVGAAAPSWSLSGPGELDLFGEHIPTVVHFTGPVRPRLQLTRITMSEQLAQFAHGGAGGTSTSLQHALVRGWEHYFGWQIAAVAVFSVALAGAVAGWQRRSRRHTLIMLAVGLAVAETINLGAIMTTAYTAPQRLSRIASLQALVGGAPVLPPAATPVQATSGTSVVVIGDSTAAGLGNGPLPRPTALDTACQRSVDAFAVDLATVNNWQVTNLACSGATIRAGLLGPQRTGDATVPAQLDSPALANAAAVVISVGANDVSWSGMVALCAASPSCEDRAEQAYFQQSLSGFSQDYLQLLTQLAALPRHPQVIVNLYYDPFSDDSSCPGTLFTAAKRQALRAKLAALNAVLAKGAKAASFTTADPDFTGHGLCSDQPYVQGLAAAAPFHPTSGGELAIALADERALHARAG